MYFYDKKLSAEENMKKLIHEFNIAVGQIADIREQLEQQKEVINNGNNTMEKE